MNPLKWLLAFVPGGQIVALASSVASIAAKALEWALAFVKWFMVDISDAFKEPQRLVVRTICVVGALAFGLYAGIELRARKDATIIKTVTQQRDAAVTERNQWRQRYETQEARAKEADEARKQAEQRIRDLTPPAAPPADRVRQRTPSTAPKPNKASGSGLFGPVAPLQW